MSERILKLLETERQLTGPFYTGQSLIRVFNDTASAVLLTVKDSGTTTGTVTVRASEVVFIRKKAAETLEASASVKSVPVAFGD